MTINKLNPNNPVLRAADEQWMKIAAVLVHKFGGDIRLTDADFAAFPVDGALAIGEEDGCITLQIANPAEAARLVAKHGGRTN